MIKACILGATGYSGVEAVRLLHEHPKVEVAHVFSRSQAGLPLREVYPHLWSVGSLVLEDTAMAPQLAADCQVAFLALPHGAALQLAPALLDQGLQVIDLGADFRLAEAGTYQQWYGLPHTATDLLAEAAYGLPELFRKQVCEARLVANPGCYPTASIIALAPLVSRGLAAPGPIIIDAKSGVSGAGRGLSLTTHFCEVNDNFTAYKVGGSHRHTPEIEQRLSQVADAPVSVNFTPHLVPMTRGILATCHVRLAGPLTAAEATAVYAEFYAGEPFIDVLPAGLVPRTRSVYGSNRCQLSVAVDARTGMLTVFSVIDNLVKGAAGQAVQNMNLMLGFEETLGLPTLGLVP